MQNGRPFSGLIISTMEVMDGMPTLRFSGARAPSFMPATLTSPATHAGWMAKMLPAWSPWKCTCGATGSAPSPLAMRE